MSDKLKKFVSAHRPEFDTSEPGKDLWAKIDAKVAVKHASRISGKWASTFKYLGFGLSLLTVALFLIAKNLTSPATSIAGSGRNDSTRMHSIQYPDAYLSRPRLTANKNHLGPESPFQNTVPVSWKDKGYTPRAALDSLIRPDSDSLFGTPGSDEKKNGSDNPANLLHHDAGKIKTTTTHEKKENATTGTNKGAKLYIPREPEKINSFTGTLYDGSAFCAMLRAYKFPGKVGMGDGDVTIPRHYKLNLKIISCSHLESIPTIKAVWLKGKTDTKIILSLKDGFKNITLLKPNGKQLHPEAISHYYSGRGAISGYSGRRFSMVFKRNMELILFFKDAEEGDKILVNGIMEATVTGQP